MDYKEFLETLAAVDWSNAQILKEGFNKCDVCFDYLLELRELIGRVDERIADNKKDRKDDLGIIHYYGLNQAVLNATSEATMCSHLKELINIPSMEKGPMFMKAREMLASVKQEV